MAKPSTPPELMEAYKLLKAAERGPAARVLKQYLTKHPRDEMGWWLMAHAVTRPDNVRTCLERVLKINPQNAKARAKLDALRPSIIDDEPDDSFFGVSSADDPATPASAAAPAPPAATDAPPISPPPEPAPTTPEPFAPPDAPAAPDAEAPDEAAVFAGALNGIGPFTVPVDDVAFDGLESGPPSTGPFTDADAAGWHFNFEADAPGDPFTAAPVPAFEMPEVPPGTRAEVPGWLAQLDASDLQDPFATGPVNVPAPADPAADWLKADSAPPEPPAGRPAMDVVDPFAALAHVEPALADPFGAVDTDEDPFADIPVEPDVKAPDAGDDAPAKERPSWLRRWRGGPDSG